ncbi:LysR family transcriptional regulator [Nonomuraea zeae]|uniref:LysR family transcriptional regulator n=1 Tax=Nonomuraea zeae TaxID=1642303 RepID=A0A5S4FEX2_9ACTN|nr:LysR family transcriptional regulator [Nonomuraea zeae]TMR17494.1 LysR family transcriptional regulator [Nonomuraea zeae]
MIDAHRLRVLREVAVHGSFNRAAAAMLLTPSAVSQQIAALERQLGTRVVTRSTRGVALTEPGRLLVETAETIAAELRHARERIDELASGHGRLNIATFTSAGRALLPGVLTRFVATHPLVEVNVVEREPEDSLPLVRRGEVDLAIAYHFGGPLPVLPGDRTGLRWTPLAEDPLSAVLPAAHPLAGRASVDLAELAEQPWVIGCSKTEKFLRDYAAAAGFELRISGTTSDYHLAQALTAAGLGISLVPSISLAPDTPGLVVVPVNPPRPVRYIGIATGRQRHDHPLVRTLAEWLRKEAEAL